MAVNSSYTLLISPSPAAQITTPNDSDILTVTNETEDAQWSFAAANKDVGDETQILNRNPKKSRAMRGTSVIAANINICMIAFIASPP
ncbi:conserved hypothetical protein [Histoplasma capsulatum var. duboisii H88]|uniref:Uncharacterized protein n=2 Tax=Ajellomyces capsulatus TaxID=5037 RepID=F0U5C6_AJEC8|nr:conserved hypothetical protein [Histoplasma capsulatum H143]EGC42117.1 conserved hypothetical protein [Histoplasma capsulatum var. duboisii H88]